jgi:hypothetical protein
VKEESSFLSSPETSFKIHAILEQLYEDLNSYSETSIPIDNFNSIELKIFPFYPNPPPVKDWMVPVALINFDKVVEPNWDLTMAKVRLSQPAIVRTQTTFRSVNISTELTMSHESPTLLVVTSI